MNKDNQHLIVSLSATTDAEKLSNNIHLPSYNSRVHIK